jgi:hypothetical protein
MCSFYNISHLFFSMAQHYAHAIGYVDWGHAQFNLSTRAFKTPKGEYNEIDCRR